MNIKVSTKFDIGDEIKIILKHNGKEFMFVSTICSINVYSSKLYPNTLNSPEIRYSLRLKDCIKETSIEMLYAEKICIERFFIEEEIENGEFIADYHKW